MFGLSSKIIYILYLIILSSYLLLFIKISWYMAKDKVS